MTQIKNELAQDLKEMSSHAAYSAYGYMTHADLKRALYEE